MQNKLISENEDSGIAVSPFHLTGVFSNATEKQEVIFKAPHYTWIKAGKKYSGGYTIYKLNDGASSEIILEMITLNDNGMVTGRQTYLVRYREKKEKDQLTRTLALTSVDIYIGGIRDISEKTIQFKQIEYLSKSH